MRVELICNHNELIFNHNIHQVPPVFSLPFLLKLQENPIQNHTRSCLDPPSSLLFLKKLRNVFIVKADFYSLKSVWTENLQTSEK